MESNQMVLVTGVSGFVGSMVAKLCLERGYLVRGTVRDFNPFKLQPFQKFPNYHNFSLVKANLREPSDWTKAVEGVTYVVHVASPVPAIPSKNEKEIIDPAVEGISNIVNACFSTQSVRHIVMTSSGITMHTNNSHIPSNEQHWANEKDLNAYGKSKIKAEKLFWELYHSQTKIRMTSINPGLILGPSLVSTDFSSGQAISKLLGKRIPGLPKLCFSIVDVRDVAVSHILAFEKGEISNGERYICCGESLWFKQIGQILKDEFSRFGYNVPTLALPNWMIKFAAIVRTDIKAILPYLNKPLLMDNSKIKQHFGIKFISSKEAVISMAYSLIEHGQIPNKIKQ